MMHFLGLFRLWKGCCLSTDLPVYRALNSAYSSVQCHSSLLTMYLKHKWINTNHLQSSREGMVGILFSRCLHGANKAHFHPKLMNSPKLNGRLPNMRWRQLSTQILNVFEAMRRERSICSGKGFRDKVRTDFELEGIWMSRSIWVRVKLSALKS